MQTLFAVVGPCNDTVTPRAPSLTTTSVSGLFTLLKTGSSMPSMPGVGVQLIVEANGIFPSTDVNGKPAATALCVRRSTGVCGCIGDPPLVSSVGTTSRTADVPPVLPLDLPVENQESSATVLSSSLLA